MAVSVSTKKKKLGHCSLAHHILPVGLKGRNGRWIKAKLVIVAVIYRQDFFSLVKIVLEFFFFFFRWVSMSLIFHLRVQLCVQKASRLISFLPFTLHLIINSPHPDNAVENKSTIFQHWCSLPIPSPSEGRAGALAVCCFYLMRSYFHVIFSVFNWCPCLCCCPVHHWEDAFSKQALILL